jgi:hypothetical protein
VGSFRQGVAADFDGNGTSDIGFIEGKEWKYSPDGQAPLKVMRKGDALLKPLLTGSFRPVEGQASRAQVASWGREVASVDARTGKITYTHGSRLVAWRGLGSGNGLVALSAQNMR